MLKSWGKPDKLSRRGLSVCFGVLIYPFIMVGVLCKLCLFRTLHEDHSDHNLEGSARLWLGELNLALGTIGI